MLDPQEHPITDRPHIVIYEDDDEILFGFTDERWAAISDDPREPLTPLPDPDVGRLRAASMNTTITFHGQELGVGADVLAAAGIIAGDSVIVEATDEGVLVRRQTVTDEIDADYAAGRFRRFNSDEAFIAHLDSLAGADAS